MRLRIGLCATVLLAATNQPTRSRAITALAPQVEHHQHLLSPMLAGRLLEVPAAPSRQPSRVHGISTLT